MEQKPDINKILMQLELGKRQMDQMGRQSQMIESAIAELNSTLEALNSIKDQKPGTEVMMPLGAGSYMRAALKDNENVMLGIGAEMYVEKKLPDATETLRERAKKLAESHASLQKSMAELGTKLNAMSGQAEEMMGQARSG
ncbi:MAG: prefoldin subunit alpha [Candidatus Altiarchaeota archaeon]